jgi:hypothetical protein
MHPETGMTTEYPVHYAVDRPERFTRLQLLARVVAFMALGVIGLSFGTVFFFAYLALPVFAASRLASSHEPGAYVGRDGPRVANVLRWFAAICAWAGLTTEHLPNESPPETIRLEIEGTAHPTPSSALWRVVAGIPSALVLAVLGCIGSFVWLWAALSVLFSERVGKGAHEYLVGLQRWSVRLLAYQASLVDAYPPFSFSDTASPILPPARVAS